MAYTTSDLLTSVRNRGSIPTTSNTSNANSTSALLTLATEEMHIKLVPLIMSVREEFYVTKKEFAVTAGQAEYDIPTRATGLVLRDVQLITGSSICSLSPIDSEYITSTGTGDVRGYYLEHNKVVLYPTPSATNGTLRIRYFLRPSILAETSSCAKITAVDTANNQVTVSSYPSTWAVGTTVDFVKSTSPYANPDIDVAITGISGSIISFSALPSGLAVGDWLGPAGYSPVPQLPIEFQAVLAQMTVVRALDANGDKDGAVNAWKDLQTNIENAVGLITPRNQGERKKIIQRSWR